MHNIYRLDNHLPVIRSRIDKLLYFGIFGLYLKTLNIT